MGVLSVSFTADPARAIVYVSPRTEVRSIDFAGVESLREADLRSLLQTKTRAPLLGFRNALGKLPVFDSPPRHYFAPRVLQEDVVRLRQAYWLAGYLEAEVRYDVRPVQDKDLLDITFLVEEGDPQRVAEVTVVSADSLVPLPVPAEERESWEHELARARKFAGQPLNVTAARGERDRLQSWWRERGFSAATVQAELERDSVGAEGNVRFRVDAGRRSKFGPVTVEGNEEISDGAVQKQLSFRPGDEYSESALRKSREDLQRLEIVRTANVELGVSTDSVAGGGAAREAAAADSSADELLPVRVRIIENEPRLITGQLGYVTDGGISAETGWSHLSLARGGRVLTVSAFAQTGLLSVTKNPEKRYRGTISLLQPHVFDPRVSAVVSPYVQLRDDTEEHSLEVGSSFTLIYEPIRFFSSSLDYRIATRNVYEYRFGSLESGDLDLLSLLEELLQGDLDGLGGHVQTSLVTLSGSINFLDNLGNPRRGILLRPAAQVTVPTAWSSESYWRLDGSVYGFLPLTARSTLASRLTAGRAYPFGESVPTGAVSGLAAFLGLRDATFTAGGSADVRGWAERMLGPKFPAIRFVESGDTLTTETSDYVALGGLQRVTFTIEPRLPMPGLGPSFGSHLFLDGGRVWTSDSRYGLGNDEFDQDRFYYALGGGIDYKTPVGAIRLSVGYKLNPSLLDLADSEDVLRAAVDGTPIDDVKRHQSRRWQVHFAFGSSY